MFHSTVTVMPSIRGDGSRRWHSTVGLDEFVQQVACLVEILDMTRTIKLSLFDSDTIKRAMGWGSYIEQARYRTSPVAVCQVISSLDCDWQHEWLAKALEVHANTNKSLHMVTVRHLKQARRWLLRTMLCSTFLGDHPDPRMLLRWIVSEYAKLDTHDGSRTIQGTVTRGACLNKFVVDLTHAMRSSAYTAVLSHAYSAFLACSRVHQRPFSTGHGLDTAQSESEECPHQIFGVEPSIYKLNIETTQKRAYAITCWHVLITKHKTSCDSEGQQIKPMDGANEFVMALAALARTDAFVLEVMCLMLLEPCKPTFGDDGHLEAWIDGCEVQLLLSSRQHSTLAPSILKAVLTFRSSSRLWGLDSWLLTEISQHYLPFADAYLHYIIRAFRDVYREELEIGAHATGSPKPSVVNALGTRLEMLLQRSRRLNALCCMSKAPELLAQIHGWNTSQGHEE